MMHDLSTIVARNALAMASADTNEAYQRRQAEALRKLARRKHAQRERH